MERDISYLYQTMTTKHLLEMRSKKHNRIMRIAHDFSWFSIQEKRKLGAQIKAIDAEIQCRNDQQLLFP